jgi:hypothetical protein
MWLALTKSGHINLTQSQFESYRMLSVHTMERLCADCTAIFATSWPDFERSSEDSTTAVAGNVATYTSVRDAVSQDQNGFKRAQISELEYFNQSETTMLNFV